MTSEPIISPIQPLLSKPNQHYLSVGLDHSGAASGARKSSLQIMPPICSQPTTTIQCSTTFSHHNNDNNNNTPASQNYYYYDTHFNTKKLIITSDADNSENNRSNLVEIVINNKSNCGNKYTGNGIETDLEPINGFNNLSNNSPYAATTNNTATTTTTTTLNDNGRNKLIMKSVGGGGGDGSWSNTRQNSESLILQNREKINMSYIVSFLVWVVLYVS